MFRKSRREKERKPSLHNGGGSSLEVDDGSGNTSSLKRHSKLFSFGKKDKKKGNTNGFESPESIGADGIRVEESFANKNQRTSNVHPNVVIKTVYEDNIDKGKRTDGLVEKFNNREKEINKNGSVASRGSTTLTFDFGTDTSLAFQNFTADVLRATEEKLKGVELKLPEVKRLNSEDSSRVITVKRGPAGDFGIALRRSTMNRENNKVIHLVEPSHSEITFGLLPGDKLVEVDGVNVETSSREEIIERIACAGNSVSLKVVPVPEFSELSSRTAASQAISPKHTGSPSLMRSSSFLRKQNAKAAKSDKTLTAEKEWLDAEKVWFIHAKGFSSGRLNKIKNESNEVVVLKLKLDHGGEVIDVEDEMVERANPSTFDRVEDLSTLRYLNTSGCLHTLRQRYAGDLTHTYAGNHLIIIKPKHKLGIYTRKVIEMFQGCKQEDMPPHIYAVAQTAYRSMMATNKSQSIIFRGNSGSGKTYNFKQLVNYYSALKTPNVTGVGERLNSAITLVESFTQCRTSLSRNASSARMLYTMEFDTSGFLIGATTKVCFINKFRVVNPPSKESSYRIFYELLDGCDAKLKETLMLTHLPNLDNVLFDFNQQFDSKEKQTLSWKNFLNAVKILDISNEEMLGFLSPIAAIVLLGVAGITAVAGSKPYFANPTFANKAASVLGTSEEILSRLIFSKSSLVPKTPHLSRSNSSTSQTSEGSLKIYSPSGSLVTDDSLFDYALSALKGFCTGLYIEAFTALVRLINNAINTSAKVGYRVNILDGPGFHNKNSINKAGTFEDLCTNYCCERLQWFQHYCNFTAKLERYNRENIDCKYDPGEIVTPDVTITALDKLTVERRISLGDLSDNKKGLLWILEEEALKPNSNELLLVERISTFKENANIISTDNNLPECFIVSHLQNATRIRYSVNAWLRNIREHLTTKMAYGVLSDSNKSHIANLYAGHQSGVFSPDQQSTFHGRHRKKSMATHSSAKKHTVTMQLKSHMDQLFEIIENTQVHFIHCILPEPLDGLIDSQLVSLSDEDGGKTAPTFSVPYVREQFNNSFLLESMRIHRQGYPDCMSFNEFRRRFDILVIEKGERNQDPVLDEKQAVCDMVKQLDLEERSFKLGLSKIFFRSGVLAQLEDTRDDKLSETIVAYQALCRGYLARKHLKKLQYQHIAIRCVQRNIRKFMLVRNWSWWRLYTKVLPLIDVHKTEEQLKNKTSEVSTLNQKIEKLSKENEAIGDENTRLKKKVQELSLQLSEVHSASTGTDDLLEQESIERLRLEEELEKSRMETLKLTRQRDQLESEISDLKFQNMNGGYHDGGVDEEEFIENDNVWREKYKALSRELENTRRKMNDQAEEEIQDLMNQKRIAEKALGEERAETDEVRRQLNNSKRKLNKVNGEMDDMKLLLESLQGRNSELEKKQRKFDHEMSLLHDELNQEKAQRESAEHERDKFNSEKHSLQNQLNEYQDEVSQLKRKIERLNSEMDDNVSSGKADAELTTLKRQLREQESKMQDQEEELDDQAAQIQQLEQTKLRLEMASQRDKQQFQRDVEAKDEEIEHVKAEYQRKMRAVEEQIDEEIHRKEEISRAKRELERKLFDLQTTADEADRSTERKLKKELKKLRILYKDAKQALDSQVGKQTDQTEVKALRNQLEDAEFAKHMAIKAKQQIEADMEELNTQIDNLTKAKEASEERCLVLSRENGDLQSRIDDGEDEMEEIIRNNKQLITQLTEAQNAVIEMREKYRKLEDENDSLNEKVTNLTHRVEGNMKNLVDKMELEKAHYKMRELESKSEVEGQARIKLEHQVNRLKGQLERLQDERTELQNNQSRIQQNSSRFERQVKELRNELDSLKRQESDAKRRREESENRLQLIEEELSRKKNELINSEKRIRDLQESLEHEMANSSDEDVTFTDDFDESDDSLSRTSSINQKRSFSNRNRRRLSKKMSSDSFEMPLTSFRPSRSFTKEDNISSPSGNNRNNSYTSEPRDSFSSRTPSRFASKQISRQNSID